MIVSVTSLRHVSLDVDVISLVCFSDRLKPLILSQVAAIKTIEIKRLNPIYNCYPYTSVFSFPCHAEQNYKGLGLKPLRSSNIIM